MKRAWIPAVATALALLTGAGPAHARDRIKLDKSGVPLEAPEVNVDHVANSYEQEAISKLAVLLKKTRQPQQQAKMLHKMATLQQKQSDIAFRIAHGEAYAAHKPINLTRHRQALLESIATLTELISKHRGYPELPSAYLMRAKALRDVDDKKAASQDYLYIEKNYPNRPEIRAAYIELAELAEEAGDYNGQIKYLTAVERSKQDAEYYAFALYKLAWAHYQIDKVDRAFTYVRLHTAFQNGLLKKALAEAAKAGHSSPPSSSQLQRDELLADSALFYLKGLNLKLSTYSISSALAFFERLATGPASAEALNNLVIRFANLLRTENRAAELAQFKTTVVRSWARRPEALKVLMVAYEDQINKYALEPLMASVSELIALHRDNAKSFAFKPAEKMLLESAVRLQTMISKAGKKADQVGGVVQPGQMASFTRALEIVYKGFLVIADPANQPAIIRAHYNLAESLVAQDKNMEAAVHYRWIFHNGKASGTGPLEVNPVDAGLKAAAIEYDALKTASVIPKDIVARPMEDPKAAAAPLNPAYSQWVSFVESIEKFYRGHPLGHRIEFFRFEANRALYAQGHVREALELMKPFIRRNPGGQFAVPTARLVVDTLVASQAWAETELVASEFLKLQGWKDAQFQKDLYVVASDSSYKVSETWFNARKFQETVDKGKDFLAKFNASRRKEDVVSLIARASLELHNDKVAMSYLTTIIDEMPSSKYFDRSLLLRASLAERRYEFAASMKDYRRYLKLQKDDSADIRGKILLMAWLSGDAAELKAAVRDRSLCADSVQAVCERFALHQAIVSESPEFASLVAASSGRKGKRAPASSRTGESEALRTLLELQQKKNFSLDQRLERVQAIVSGWSEVDPLVRFSLVGRLHDIVTEQFRHLRVEVREKTAVKADRVSIQRRVGLIQRVEKAASEIIKLPLARVQVSLLNEVASLYGDLAEDVKSIAAPAGLTEAESRAYRETMEKIAAPFAATGHSLRGRAFELASSAGVEGEIFQSVAEQYFAEAPDAGKGYLIDGEYPALQLVSTKWLERFDPDGKYDPVIEESADQARRVRGEWMRALNDKSWPRVAFYLQEGAERGGLKPAALGLMRAISLASIGARAESISELEDVATRFDVKTEARPKAQFQAGLVKLYMTTLARKKVAEVVRQIPDDVLTAELESSERKLAGAWTIWAATAQAGGGGPARSPAFSPITEGK